MLAVRTPKGDTRSQQIIAMLLSLLLLSLLLLLL